MILSGRPRYAHTMADEGWAFVANRYVHTEALPYRGLGDHIGIPATTNLGSNETKRPVTTSCATDMLMEVLAAK